MNILFLYSEQIDPTAGGVERVSFNLGNYFESCGYNIFFLGKNSCINTTDKRQYYLPDSSCTSESNIHFFCDFLKKNSIRIVINQGGTSPEISELSYYCKAFQVKLISVVHNSLLSSIINFDFVYDRKFEKLGISWLLTITRFKIFKDLLLKLYKYKHQRHYRSLCKESDIVLLLSYKFKNELIFFLDEYTVPNVLAIPNPTAFCDIVHKKKKKEILYVGRINCSQKRVDILLLIWSRLCNNFNDWTLNIVGEGSELNYIKVKSRKLGLINILFHGKTDPMPFYETASIICMTSSFEGLPMTLIEAMQFGAVPIAFDSFVSASDLIENNVDGCLIAPFDINQYVIELRGLMSDTSRLNRFSLSAIEKSKKFDISNIGPQWLSLFNSLN